MGLFKKHAQTSPDTDTKLSPVTDATVLAELAELERELSLDPDFQQKLIAREEELRQQHEARELYARQAAQAEWERQDRQQQEIERLKRELEDLHNQNRFGGFGGPSGAVEVLPLSITRENHRWKVWRASKR